MIMKFNELCVGIYIRKNSFNQKLAKKEYITMNMDFLFELKKKPKHI